MHDKTVEMAYGLIGKTALITGASGGLGEQFARCLAAAGARVILTARRLDKLQSLALEIGNAVALEMNVASTESVARTFNLLEEQGELIDVCINNAGIFRATPVFETDEQDDFETVMQTNVMGVWYVAKAAANHMKQHAICGSIINISSVNGENYLKAERAGYCASKAAVIQMTRALVSELASSNIRINTIVPGTVRTPATEYKYQSEESRVATEKRIPLNFIADPRDLDGIILYLSSNITSRYVTGSCVTCDGGVSWGSFEQH